MPMPRGKLYRATSLDDAVVDSKESTFLEFQVSDKINVISIPLRRMTQAELDAFLEKAADILRGNVDHSEFRGYVFALLFFKRISDIFEASVRKLAKDLGDELANDPAMQRKSLPFVVPPDAMWEVVTSGTKEKPVSSLTLGQSLNDAMLAIERANAPKFDGILTNKIDFNKQDELPRSKLVERKNHFSSRKFDRAHVPDDLFGDAYEYLCVPKTSSDNDFRVRSLNSLIADRNSLFLQFISLFR
jgi:type I restriction enzyme M protein